MKLGHDTLLLVASLLLVAMPFAPSSFLLLVLMPGATSSFLLLVAMPLLLVASYKRNRGRPILRGAITLCHGLYCAR